MPFYTKTTEGVVTDCSHLRGAFHDPDTPNYCWILGAGPSLLDVPERVLREVSDTPVPKFAINYAGRGPDGRGWLLKPTHWTAYDSTPRFSPLLFRDATIMKFVKAGKEMDLVPQGVDKVCDSPSTYFIRTEPKPYSRFVDTTSDTINNSRDSFIQVIDLAVRLGFRTLLCLGAELRVRPSKAQMEYAREVGVEFEGDLVVHHFKKSDLYFDFVSAVAEASSVTQEKAFDALAALERERQYSIDESKDLRTAASSDHHYWTTVQYLRLARRNLSLNGVKLISCTPGSRLNSFFPYRDVEDAIADVYESMGRAEEETTLGKYSRDAKVLPLPYHKDIKPYGWEDKKREEPKRKVGRPKKEGGDVRDALQKMQNVKVEG